MPPDAGTGTSGGASSAGRLLLLGLAALALGGAALAADRRGRLRRSSP